MYEWRKLSKKERENILERRRAKWQPWHSAPHEGGRQEAYHLFAACYEHRPIISLTPSRLEECETLLLETVRPFSVEVFAWCILPNHYHILFESKDAIAVIAAIGKFHGRQSYAWNGEDNQRGLKVWCGCAERRIRSESHFWAFMNYVHHNPVRHEYVKRWQDWPYSSAREFFKHVGIKEAERIWREFPIMDYGEGWDDFE